MIGLMVKGFYLISTIVFGWDPYLLFIVTDVVSLYGLGALLLRPMYAYYLGRKCCH
jgi:hypothetical protein